MTNRPTRQKIRGKGPISVSVLVGTLLVPLSALAAVYLTGPASSDETIPESSTPVSESPTVFVADQQSVTSTTLDLSEDLASACGEAGLELVALEAEGTISGVQQAALDALRDICGQEDMPLPDKPIPEPVVRTVEVQSTASSPSPSATSSDGYDDEDEDDDHEYQDHEDEDEDHEDEDHEHEDHEDD